MCLTIPAQILRCEGNKAVVLQYDKTVEVNISFMPDVKPGDWILYISSVAIKKIDKTDAEEILELLESKPQLDIAELDPKFVDIIKDSKVRNLTKDEIIYLLKTEGLEREALYREAEITRKTYIRDFICVHGIIEFSNHCRNSCNYCGLRNENSGIKRYRMEPDEVIDCAVNAVNIKGYKLLVLQSGEDTYYSKEMLVRIVKEIKSKCKVFIFISIGDRDYDTYKELKDAGVSGVLYRFEVSNPLLAEKVHDKDINERFKHLEFMKELGYFIASGSIIGLPGQTVEDMAMDLLTMKKLGINMISMGPFVPCSNTPYNDKPHGMIDINLKMISVARLMMKNIRIPVVTALETLDPVRGRGLALRAGANALMFNLTPEKYCIDYMIYPERFIERNSIFEKYALFNNDGSYQMLEERLSEEVLDFK